MARSLQPGLHDPYWYEAIVGLSHVVDLLLPETGVRSVTFQAPAVEGLDDIVVGYANGDRVGIQVRHSRVEGSLTHADIVSSQQGTASLLKKLARGWKQLSANGVRCTTRLFSNRPLSDQSRAGRPPLSLFWPALAQAVTVAPRLADISLPQEFHRLWAEWREELGELTDEEKIRFLQTMRVDAGEPDSAGLETKLIGQLSVVFGVPQPIAERVYDRLLSNLRVWTTSRRGDAVEVTREQVLSAIRVPGEEQVGEHDFAPPAPFFPSRRTFVAQLAGELLAENSEPITFLTGPAGCGKTSIVSELTNRLDPLVDLRFHAFRPISPDAATIAPDYSQSATAAALWGDLLVQLRTRHFVGRLAQSGLPVRNDFLGDDPARLRSHVLDAAARLAVERGRRTLIAIDGVDHAARGRALAPEQLRGRPSLLDWLVPPADVPAGVRFLIAGQPHEGYPLWLLRSSAGVRSVDIPPVEIDDVEVLLQ